MLHNKPINYRTQYFVSSVRKFAERHDLALPEAYAYLYKYRGIEFLDQCYEAEHTLSFDDTMADLSLVCRNNGGYLE